MHIHLLGICGTFMGGLALIARELGHTVTGSDENIYPPMSTLLQSEGVQIRKGYDPDHLNPKPDLVIVGNAMSRGKPIVEAMLNLGLKFTSGPEWLGTEVLSNRYVIAIAGTHGKTSTSSMATWILEQTGADPGYLIGGVPAGLDVSARLGTGPWFIIEADEYDTAFFDKRSKFVHYHPNIAVLNNLEFDHADIFDNVEAIERQFHHLVRIVPGSGLIICNGTDQHLSSVLKTGCWSPVEYFLPPTDDTVAGAPSETGKTAFRAKTILHRPDGSSFDIQITEQTSARVDWGLIGKHNVANALAATLATLGTGVTLDAAASALSTFSASKRRLELIARKNDIEVYDDFAHHPTAVKTTLNALRAKAPEKRLVAVVEFRSNTMRMGVHNEQMLRALNIADRALVYKPPVNDALSADEIDVTNFDRESSDGSVSTFDDYALIEKTIYEEMTGNEHIVIMSNGGFDGLPARVSATVAKL